MATSWLTAINLSDNELLNHRLHMLAANPTNLEAKIYYNSVAKEIRYFDGTVWVALGASGAGGPPSGSAGGDLTGSYPNPQIAAGVIVDGDIAAGAAISSSKISGLDTALTGKASTATTITAGNGLTGGGDLTANRTISALAANATISVAAPGLSVVSAPKWTTGQTITLTGDVTGVSTAWDGSAGISFVTAIAAGAITDADLAGSISQSKITNLTTDLAARVLKAGDTMTGFLTANADPTNALHYATKQYVDLASQGFTFKNAVRVVSTGNVATSGLLTVDGVTLVANDRVLLAGQSTASQNGIWVAAAGAWARSTDMDANGELADGTLVPVSAGTANSDSLYMCTAIGATPWVAGTSTSTWTKFSSLSDLSAGAGLLKTGGTIDFQTGDTTLTVSADSVVVNATVVEMVARKNAANGYAGLDAGSKVVIGQIPTGTTGTTVALGNHTHTGMVLDTRSVIAGNGLTGGGTLASDVTLNVVGDANLSVTADQVAVLSAPKWTTPRSITLTGDVTGTVASVDGSANVSIATTVVSGGSFARKFSADVPTGATPALINHALGTKDVDVQVFRNTTPWDTVYCDVERPDINNIQLRFASAAINPAAGTYRVVVRG